MIWQHGIASCITTCYYIPWIKISDVVESVQCSLYIFGTTSDNHFLVHRNKSSEDILNNSGNTFCKVNIVVTVKMTDFFIIQSTKSELKHLRTVFQN